MRFAAAFAFLLAFSLPAAAASAPAATGTAPASKPAMAAPRKPGLAVARPAVAWSSYSDPQFGFSIDVPYGLFAARTAATPAPGLTLAEVKGGTSLRIFGRKAPKAPDVAKLANTLSNPARISSVTYQAGTQNWYVVSGFYTDKAADGSGNRIFYTKVMLNPARTAFSVFSVVMPASEKPRMTPIINRLEKTLTAPK